MAAVTREFVCHASIEVETEAAVRGFFQRDDSPYYVLIPKGTTVETECGFAVEATLDSVVGLTGRAQWECPQCGTTNTEVLSADDLG